MSTKLLTEPFSVIITNTLKGEETSTNSVATIFAWTGASSQERRDWMVFTELQEFADKLGKSYSYRPSRMER